MNTREENINKFKEYILNFHIPGVKNNANYADIYYDKISSRHPRCSQMRYEFNSVEYREENDTLFNIGLSCCCETFPIKNKNINCTDYIYRIDASNISLIKEFRCVGIDIVAERSIFCSYYYIDKSISIIENSFDVNSPKYRKSNLILSCNGSEEDYNLICEKYIKLRNIL